MEKTKMETERLKELSDKLRGFLEMECCGSVKDIETAECGEVVDMIKDLAEAKKCCWEAYYYQTVCEAMKKGEERNGSYEDSMGYNTNRYASGRYAPTGHGDSTMGYPYFDRMGFQRSFPYDMFSPYMMDECAGRMGYTGNSNGGNNGSSSGNSSSYGNGTSGGDSGRSGFHTPDMMMYDPRYGESFNRYREAKRHYTETHSNADKEQMENHAEQHMKDAMDTTKEVYKSASPELKKKYKEELLALVNSLPVS